MDQSRVRVVGPLAVCRDGFDGELRGQGYTPGSASLQLLLMAHVSRWLASRGLTAAEFTPVRAAEFLESRRADGYTSRLSQRGLTQLLDYLRCLGVVPLPSEPVATPVEVVVAAYRDYLTCERGLALAVFPLVDPLFLHRLRSRHRDHVRRLRRYYGTVRLPTPVHPRITASAFPGRPPR